MAVVEVKLPELGKDAGNEARVSFWYVEKGERVAKDDDLVQMITDKATFDVPSPTDGRVVELVADEDEEVKVGQVLCRIETERNVPPGA
jgi:pyruvate/2-oxoglutarate dehydrogenase complex dihydrolipoamide acyltransferase (E2) component